MINYSSVLSIWTLFIIYYISNTQSTKPNIIFMFGDDIGYNDVGFTSSDLETSTSYTLSPHINNLATTEGVIINSYFVNRMCSPTRASFLSGRYSFRFGLNTHLIEPDVKLSLTRQVSLISEEFSTAGYNTHAIGYIYIFFFYPFPTLFSLQKIK